MLDVSEVKFEFPATALSVSGSKDIISAVVALLFVKLWQNYKNYSIIIDSFKLYFSISYLAGM